MKKNTVNKLMTLALSLAMTLSLAACGGGSGSSNPTPAQSGSSGQQPASGSTYKVGIIKFMDHASLNQIEDSLQAELDRQIGRAHV